MQDNKTLYPYLHDDLMVHIDKLLTFNTNLKPLKIYGTDLSLDILQIMEVGWVWLKLPPLSVKVSPGLHLTLP